MAKQDSTPKETSGGGFLFETEVVAYVLAHLLARSSPFDPPGGGIEGIDVQRPASEWHYDDLLVTVRAGGTRHRLAFCIKSNRQVTPKGFPPVPIRHGWEQILQHSSDVFDETTDFLGLVTSPVGPSLKHEVYELLGMARDQEPGDLAFQVQLPNRANATRRKLHESARCPAELENEAADLETNPGRLLRRLLWSPFDFEEENSQRRAEAQRICRDLLLSGSTEEASALWGALKEIARRLRRHGGGMGLHRLVEELRGRFELRTFPDYRRDWQRLDDETRSAIVRARSTIGGRVSLPRKVVHEAISELFGDRRTVVLVGASGTGKSVIAKIEAEGAMRNGKALWLDSGRISARTLAGWRGHLNLDHAMTEVISSTTASDALLVLDGLDRIFDENSFATAAEFVKACRVGESASPWRLLVTCTEEAWPRVRDDLVSRGVPLPKDQPMLLGLPEESELNEVWTSFPRLGTLRGRRHLTPVLLRPKVLDLLATHSSQGDDLALMGESHVARLLWGRLIAKGPHAVVRAQVVRRLAGGSPTSCVQTPRSRRSPLSWARSTSEPWMS